MGRIRRRVAAVALTAATMLALAACGPGEDPVTIGLITKQEENTYWVTMREVAERVAAQNDVELVTATGTSDVDVASQQAAMEEMIADGVDGILIAPTSSTELNPLIAQAREAGIIVIALDTPVDPVTAVDAYYATDNLRAGELAGQYAAAKAGQLGLTPVILTLDLAPGIESGIQRLEGFFTGFGIEASDPAVVATADSEGDRELAATATAQAYAANPDINVVYAVNEPAAFGALDALGDAGADLSRIVLVTVDGGCDAIKDGVRPGRIDATVQQYPENMAREGVLRIADAVRGGERPSGYLDTGIALVSGDPAPGVSSENVEFGVRNCWGD